MTALEVRGYQDCTKIKFDIIIPHLYFAFLINTWTVGLESFQKLIVRHV